MTINIIKFSFEINPLKINVSIIDIIREIINFLTNKKFRKLFIKLINSDNIDNKMINIINHLSKIEIYTANNTNNDTLLLSIISIIHVNNLNININNFKLL